MSDLSSHRVGCGVFFVLLVFGALASPAHAKEGVEEPVKQAQVAVGTYINEVYDLSLKDNKFSVDFYIWFRWQGGELKPHDSFEVVNGRTNSKEVIYSDTIEGTNYTVSRVHATITKFWDISRFPMDNHTLSIAVEDSQNEEFKFAYVPDITNSNHNPALEVPGWKVAKNRAQVVPHGYKTNYGDIRLLSNNELVYSRFIFSIDVVRPGYGYFIKLFLSVFIATLIAFLALLIKPTDLDPRFGLGVGAIFAAIASEYVVVSSLPDSNLITLADKLHILAIVFIFLSIFESVISLKLISIGKNEASRRLDHASLAVFLIVYTIGNAVVIF